MSVGKMYRVTVEQEFVGYVAPDSTLVCAPENDRSIGRLVGKAHGDNYIFETNERLDFHRHELNGKRAKVSLIAREYNLESSPLELA